ncbi:MAG: hypothetical protein ABI592_03995 [Acidobacteriota bacterium]
MSRRIRRANMRPAALWAAALLLAAAIPPTASAALSVRVGPTVQVSREGGAAQRMHEEVILAAHPKDPKRLIGCSIVDEDGYKQRGMHAVAYGSEDGGLHWKHVVESTAFDGDPMCGYGPDGRAYFLSIGTDDESWKKVDWWMEIFRSDDGGRTWGPGELMPGGDRPWLAFDEGRGKTAGWGYVVYSIRIAHLDHQGPASVPRDRTLPTLEVRRTTDGGTTWQKSAMGVMTEKNVFPSATGAVVLPDGSLAVLWLKRTITDDANSPEAARHELYMTVSEPGANLLGPSVKIADLVSDHAASATFYSLAMDATAGPRRGHLYATWTDTGTPRAKIFVASSGDSGKTWSIARANGLGAPAGDAPLDDFQPTVAVNRDGIVGLSFRRRTRDTDDGEVYFTASEDGGATWMPPVLVSSPRGAVEGGLVRPTFRADEKPDQPGSRRRTIFKGGDTGGLAADADGIFHALWADQRSGIGQVFTAAVTVSRAGAR